ncbi:MAG: MarC family protein [Burkholderiales bacterium]|nr:MarC family protein [Burkholderiales bacterium]
MFNDFLSAFILLLLVLDPFGALPLFISVMQHVAPGRRRLVALRETAIAFVLLLAFLLAGPRFLQVMSLSQRSLEVAGGVILLIIALRMVFGRADAIGVSNSDNGGEPLIVPLAVPLLAGPSAMATVLVHASRYPERLLTWSAALLAAMTVSLAMLLAAERLRRWLGDPLIAAIERLMGLVLTAVAIEMILGGLKRYLLGSS